jgi:hypothetical protein
MRRFLPLLIFALRLSATAYGQTACTGLCLQQMQCAGNATTSITGVVYAPNGADPLPNITVYIPNAPVAAFTPGVSCDVVGAPPSGSPLIGTTSAVDGTFTLADVPVGTNIPLVIVSGRWRRQLVIPTINACVNNPLPATFAVMPQNQSQGDIPRIAIATGAVDQVECILRKVGIADTEFTDPGGGGRINFFSGSGGPGAVIDSATPNQAALMESASTLDSYDVLMLPCQGTPNNNVVSGTLGTQELTNFVNFANAGGRIYSSHFSYAWMYNNPPFNGVANWAVSQSVPSNLTSGTIPATVNTSFTAGNTLAQWLQLEGASTTLGQIGLQTIKHDLNGVIAPTQSWLTLNDAMGTDTNPVMQFVFDTPIAAAGTTVNQCGRVLYNEYHVENGTSSPSLAFPAECSSTAALDPQEKLLEYMLFELTAEGGQPSISPTSLAFGSETVGFTTPTQTLTWTNNSSFPSSLTSALVTGPFNISSNNCASVAAGASCTIAITFTPTALGGATGTLTIVSSGNTLTAPLTGTGTSGFTLSASQAFGNVDVGASAGQTLTLTSLAPGPLPAPVFATTGPFSVNTSACGATVAAMATCNVVVTFSPLTTGPQSGTLNATSTSALYSGLSEALSGNGVDFSLTLTPTSGTVVAGDSVTTTATITPLAGYSANLALNCTVATGATGSACALGANAVTPTTQVTESVTINTTSQYTIIGFSGLGGGPWLWLLALASGALLFITRRGAPGRRFIRSARLGLFALLLTATGLALTGCSGKLPAQHSVYTGPGAYTITVSATDGFLTHSATYTLTVTAQ